MQRRRERKNSENEGQSGEESESVKLEWRASNFQGKKHLQMRFQSKTAFVNQINFKNATAFFTNAFKRKPALNKEYSFNLFALVTLSQ